MKNIFLFSMCLFMINSKLQAQKEDYHWILGYGPNDSTKNTPDTGEAKLFGNTFLDWDF